MIIIHPWADCPVKKKHCKIVQSLLMRTFIFPNEFDDIVTSFLPNWKTRLWVLARPMTGFAETFSHYLMDISPGGGSNLPDEDEFAEHVIFVTSGAGKIKVNDDTHYLIQVAIFICP